MELCYDGALVMPSNYAVMKEEEMTYVEGGWCIENKWWGYNIYLSHEERKLLSAGQIIGGAGSLFIKTLGGPAAAIIGALWQLFANYDDGYGIRIRMTGVLKAQATITGIYSLSKREQRKYAYKDAVIW